MAKRVTGAPEGVNFVSASRPKLPIKMTLFTLREAIITELYHMPGKAWIDRRREAESLNRTEVLERFHRLATVVFP